VDGENGKPLPGGARRLRNAVDSRIDLPFEAVRKAMCVELRVPKKRPAPRMLSDNQKSFALTTPP
jgi:hypothetical protein